ncbi:hypothetical protein SAMN05444487_104185 [Marininema mesophilum]|uniref:YIEGIA protein n=1 Tax=Marininema mesophilum TaxID=1048340 RepID=A0A1H2UQN8_9BACL|nr:YIEGIA family protein [Marininema mesophilum]SDW58405.1 hypothetical protein SAMN05444487_104185 [Marininema mesophilum]
MEHWFSLLNSYTGAIIVGVVVGVIVRLRMLRTDYRQYPTYLHGQLIHISLGFIAAGMGAVAVPALIEKQYTAVTFLALAAQQFREVRNMERETLAHLEEDELVPRGSSYIEGIALAFEGRNYAVIMAAFLCSLAVIEIHLWAGVLLGLALIGVAGILRSGKYLGQITSVELGKLRMEGPSLYVDDIYLMNIGLEDNRKRIMNRGIGVVVSPASKDSRITLANLGQRQAILHDLSVVLGVFRDTGEPSLIPLSKRDMEDGRLGILCLPEEKEPEQVLQVIRNVPVLESAVRTPTEGLKMFRGGKKSG